MIVCPPAHDETFNNTVEKNLYEWKECGKALSSSKSLRKHGRKNILGKNLMNVSNVGKPSIVSYLGRHKRRHDGNKPHEQAWPRAWGCRRRLQRGSDILASALFSWFPARVGCWAQPSCRVHLLQELSAARGLTV